MLTVLLMTIFTHHCWLALSVFTDPRIAQLWFLRRSHYILISCRLQVNSVRQQEHTLVIIHWKDLRQGVWCVCVYVFTHVHVHVFSCFSVCFKSYLIFICEQYQFQHYMSFSTLIVATRKIENTVHYSCLALHNVKLEGKKPVSLHGKYIASIPGEFWGFPGAESRKTTYIGAISCTWRAQVSAFLHISLCWNTQVLFMILDFISQHSSLV